MAQFAAANIAPTASARAISLSLGLLCAFLVYGCSLPSSVTSLDQLVDGGVLSADSSYGYRCTRGAHRGASVDFTENSLLALQEADRSSKYAFIEFDVQYTKDKKIIVYHDKRLLRLFGDLRQVGETTFAELKELTGGEIITYEEAIGTLRKKINIEIKSQGDLDEDRQLVDEIMADIQARKRHRDIMISSISSEVIMYVKERYPWMPTGQVFWLTSSTYLHFDGLTRSLYRQAEETKADYIMLHTANLRNIDDLLSFKPRGKTIVFWDFDDTMHIVHKDLSDRLWGDSPLDGFYQFLQYGILSRFHGRSEGSG